MNNDNFNLPTVLNVNDYTFEAKAFFKMGYILNILATRYPEWTFKIEKASNCSLVVRFPGYIRYRYDCYKNYVYSIGGRSTKITLDQHLETIDELYNQRQ